MLPAICFVGPFGGEQSILTDVELTNEAGQVIVLEVLWKQLFGKPLLVQNAKVLAILEESRKIKGAQ